jgi:ABC-type spermidine/putrescine transport system permease subunit II
MQPVVLDRQRVRQAAAISHRVAAANFPLCLLIGLAQASGLVLASFNLRFTVMAVLAIALALADPFLVGMSNALYLRARAAAEAAQAGGSALRPPRR